MTVKDLSRQDEIQGVHVISGKWPENKCQDFKSAFFQAAQSLGLSVKINRCCRFYTVQAINQYTQGYSFHVMTV